MPFYIRDLSICEFWYLRGPLGTNPPRILREDCRAGVPSPRAVDQYRPVGNQAAQQEVSSGQASEASSTAPHSPIAGITA